SMVPGRSTSSIAIPKLMVTTSWARSANRLPDGAGAVGSTMVLAWRMRAPRHRVKHPQAQCVVRAARVAATFQGCGDLLATKLELTVEQGQEQFVFGSEVRVDRAFGESRGRTDHVDAGARHP